MMLIFFTRVLCVNSKLLCLHPRVYDFLIRSTNKEKVIGVSILITEIDYSGEVEKHHLVFSIVGNVQSYHDHRVALL